MDLVSFVMKVMNALRKRMTFWSIFFRKYLFNSNDVNRIRGIPYQCISVNNCKGEQTTDSWQMTYILFYPIRLWGPTSGKFVIYASEVKNNAFVFMGSFVAFKIKNAYYQCGICYFSITAILINSNTHICSTYWWKKLRGIILR